MFADDYSYSFSFLTGERMEGFRNIIPSQIAHYKSMNGRFIVHCLAQFFLLLGKNNFNIINTGAFLLLGILICYHGVGKVTATEIPILLLIYCGLFLATPAFGQSYLWITGASNYLYSILIILIYLIPFRAILSCEDKKLLNVNHIRKLIVPMFILSIIAGETNENNSVALTVIVILYGICYKLRNIKTRFWILGLGNMCGLLLLVIAPGEISRLKNTGQVISILGIIKQAIFITFDLAEKMHLLIFAFVLLLLAYFCSQYRNGIKIKDLINNTELEIIVIYLAGFMGAVYSMSVVSYFPERAWSGPVAFLLILVAFLFDRVKRIYNSKISQICFNAAIVLILLVSLGTYGNAYFDLKNIYYEDVNRSQLIYAAKESGQDSVEIPAINSISKYSCFTYEGDLAWKADVWPNTALAKYYGVNWIIRKDK